MNSIELLEDFFNLEVPAFNPEYPLLPPKTVIGTITDGKVTSGENEDKKTGLMRTWYRLGLTVTIDDEEYTQIMGGTEVRLPWSIFIDMVTKPDGSLAIDDSVGKNRQLSDLVKTFQLMPGQTWRDLFGRQCIAVVGQVTRGDRTSNTIEKLEAY